MEIKGYLSNQLGFSETGNFVLDNLIKPKIKQANIVILDPFAECKKELDFDHLNHLKLHKEVDQFWKTFNAKVTVINNGLMQKADCMLAILDGGHTVDDGVASEIGYYAALEKGPIFALRSDIRLAENLAAKINPQVLGYITQSGGELFEGEDAFENWAAHINTWSQEQFKAMSAATTER